MPSVHAIIGYPPDHINAVITHIIHFLGLLTFYLGIKLPFSTAWNGGKLGVGQPWICSIKGTEAGSWSKFVILRWHCSYLKLACVRWISKQCLHVSASSSQSSQELLSTSPLSQPLSESYMETDVSTLPSGSFMTGYAMLLYNVCYVAYTQAVDVPLSQAGDVLSNLWRVCCSSELGRYVLTILRLPYS
jgi:hypothetical protein